MNIKDYALEYIKFGWPVFPIVPKTKVPYKGSEWKPYQTRLPTEEEINQLWKRHPDASIGIITGGISNLCVIDLEYPQSVEHFRNTVCDLPETIISKSGSEKAGYHYFFKKPTGFNGYIKKKIKLINTPGMECDFLADGCYVLAPPSLHFPGGRNQWHNIDPIQHGLDDLLELPDEILKYALSKEGQHDSGNSNRKTDDLEDIIENGVSEGRRNDSLARISGYYLGPNGLDLTPGDTLERCLLWNELNRPPMSETEVERTVRSIAKREGKENTGRTKASKSHGQVTTDPARSAKRSKSNPAPRCVGMTAAELSKTEFKEPKWSVPGLFPEGSVILAGKPKSGKSMAALNLAVGITSGNNRVFGKIKVEPGAVLCLALEDTFRRLKQRHQQMITDGGQASPDLHLYTEWPNMGNEGLELLEEKINSIPGIRLVIIDTLGRFKPPKPNNMNIYDFDYSVTSQITELSHRCETCILIIHHLRKMITDDRFDDISSSYGITGGVDTMATLLNSGKKGGSTLNIRGRDVEEESYVMRFDPQFLAWNIEGTFDEVMSTENQQKVYNCVLKSDKPIGPKEISDKTGLSYGYTRKLVSEMARKNAIKADGHGKYKIPTVFDR